MKVIIIDPRTRTVSEHEVPDVYPHVNRLIDAPLAQVVVRYDDECVEMLVHQLHRDVEGAAPFRIEGGWMVYYGKAALVGWHPTDGHSDSCSIPLQEVRDMVLWHNEIELKFLQ